MEPSKNDPASSQQPSGVASTNAPPSATQGERVVVEHRDGAPHFTVDGAGTIRHYSHASGAEGEVMGTASPHGNVLLVDPRCRAAASGGQDQPRAPGPARVATDAYRDGWESIWGRKNGGEPS